MVLELGGSTRATSTSIRKERSVARLSQALRVVESDRDDIGDGERRVLGARSGSQQRVCWAGLSSVRGSAHPCGSATAGDGGLRSGVLQARRLAGSRAPWALMFEADAVLAERARLGILLEGTRAGALVLI